MRKRLTLEEAAAIVRRKPKTLYTWTSEKKIPHLKVNGRLLFDEAELETWLQKFQVKVESN